MRWTFDAESDAVYVWLSDAPAVNQVEVSDGTIADLDEHGAVRGLEIVSFHAGWDPTLVVEELSLDEDTAAVLLFLATYPFVPPRSSRRLATPRRSQSPVLEAHESAGGLAARSVATGSSNLPSHELQFSA